MLKGVAKCVATIVDQLNRIVKSGKERWLNEGINYKTLVIKIIIKKINEETSSSLLRIMQ